MKKGFVRRLLYLSMLPASFLLGGCETTKSGEVQSDAISSGPITEPVITEIGLNTYCINEFGMNSMYVLVGDTKALVIDTGSGFCDFKSIIGKITDLPYIVALTHAHPDHSGGIGAFEEIYMNTKDLESAHIFMDYDIRLNYGFMFKDMPIGYRGLFSFSVSDCIDWGDAFPKVSNIKEGDTFDLGNRTVMVYETPGHTDGSCSFLDENSRILFAGDAVTVNYLKNDTVPFSTALRGLLKLKGLSGQYDRLYGGHSNYAGIIDTFSLPMAVLDDQIHVLRMILSGEGEKVEAPNFINPSEKAYNVRYGRVNVQFSATPLWEEGEEEVIP